MGLGYALTEELPCKDGVPVTFDMRNIGVLRAQHMPRGRGHPGRGARAGRPVRRQGRRRDRPGADGRRGRRRARGVRRRAPHDPADEGFAGRARHQCRPHPGRRPRPMALSAAAGRPRPSRPPRRGGDGLVVATAPPDAIGCPARTARSPPARSARTPISTAASRATACRRRRRRRRISSRSSSGCGGGSTARSTPRRCAPAHGLCRPRAARRHHGADRSPRIAQPDRRLARRSRRGLRAARHARAAVLRRDRTQFRCGGRPARPRRMPPRAGVAAGARHGRTACELHRLRRHGARRRRLAGSSAPSSTSMSPRMAPTSRTRARAAIPARWSGWAPRRAAARLDPGAWRASESRAGRGVATSGCWLVQNPRSNEGNRVGYADNLAAATGGPRHRRLERGHERRKRRSPVWPGFMAT